jgi:hypothetical protein
VGFVADGRYHGERFATASYSVADIACEESLWKKLVGVFLDAALTLPVVFVWAGVWMVADNHAVLPLASFVICSLAIAALSFFEIEKKIVIASWGGVKADMVLLVLQTLWTALLAVLSIMTWRGLWETLTHSLQLAVHPLRNTLAQDHPMLALCAILAISSAMLLASIGRFRSALFPPMDFSKDDIYSSSQGSSNQGSLESYGTA